MKTFILEHMEQIVGWVIAGVSGMQGYKWYAKQKSKAELDLQRIKNAGEKIENKKKELNYLTEIIQELDKRLDKQDKKIAEMQLEIDNWQKKYLTLQVKLTECLGSKK